MYGNAHSKLNLKSSYIKINSFPLSSQVLADGSYVDPFLVFPYTRVPEPVKLKMATLENIDYNSNASGWMMEVNFKYYLEFVFVKSMKQKGIQFPVILYMDNHTSHISMDISRLAERLGVILVALYPNSTYISQPLDCAVFRGLKASWTKLLLQKRGENATFKVSMVNFAELLLELLQTSHNPLAVVNGFKVCGIYPWDVENIDFSKLLSSKKKKHVGPKEVVVPCDIENRSVVTGLNQADHFVDSGFVEPFSPTLPRLDEPSTSTSNSNEENRAFSCFSLRGQSDADPWSVSFEEPTCSRYNTSSPYVEMGSLIPFRDSSTFRRCLTSNACAETVSSFEDPSLSNVAPGPSARTATSIPFQEDTFDRFDVPSASYVDLASVPYEKATSSLNVALGPSIETSSSALFEESSAFRRYFALGASSDTATSVPLLDDPVTHTNEESGTYDRFDAPSLSYDDLSSVPYEKATSNRSVALSPCPELATSVAFQERSTFRQCFAPSALCVQTTTAESTPQLASSINLGQHNSDTRTNPRMTLEFTESSLISTSPSGLPNVPLDLSYKRPPQPPQLISSTPYHHPIVTQPCVTEQKEETFTKSQIIQKLKEICGDTHFKVYDNPKKDPVNIEQDMLMRIFHGFRPVQSATDVLTLPPINKRAGIKQTKRQPYIISSPNYRQFRSKLEKDKFEKKRKLEENKENIRVQKKQKMEAKAKEELEKKKKKALEKMEKQVKNAEKQAELKLKKLK